MHAGALTLQVRVRLEHTFVLHEFQVRDRRHRVDAIRGPVIMQGLVELLNGSDRLALFIHVDQSDLLHIVHFPIGKPAHVQSGVHPPQAAVRHVRVVRDCHDRYRDLRARGSAFDALLNRLGRVVYAMRCQGNQIHGPCYGIGQNQAGLVRVGIPQQRACLRAAHLEGDCPFWGGHHDGVR